MSVNLWKQIMRRRAFHESLHKRISARTSRDVIKFSNPKRDLNFMSRTAIASKFKMRWFPNKGRY